MTTLLYVRRAVTDTRVFLINVIPKPPSVSQEYLPSLALQALSRLYCRAVFMLKVSQFRLILCHALLYTVKVMTVLRLFYHKLISKALLDKNTLSPSDISNANRKWSLCCMESEPCKICTSFNESIFINQIFVTTSFLHEAASICL